MERNSILIDKRIKQYFKPNLMIMFFEAACYIVDFLFVGIFIGADALAAMQVVKPVSLLPLVFANMLAVGCVTVAPLYLGNCEQKSADKVFTYAVVFNLAIGLLLSLLGIFGCRQVTSFLINGQRELYPLVYDYLRIMLPGSILVVVYNQACTIMNYDNFPHMTAKMMMVINIAHYILNYLVLNYTDYGISGVAWAAVLSNCLALPFVAVYLGSKKRTLHFANISNLDTAVLTKLLTSSTSVGLLNMATIAKTLVMNIFVLASFNTLGMSVYACFQSTTYIVGLFGTVAIPLVYEFVGIAYAEKDWFSLRYACKKIRNYTVGTMIVVMGVLLVATPLVLALYGVTTGESYRFASMNIKGIALAVPFVYANLFTLSYARCIRQLTYANLITICKNFAFNVICIMLAIKIWGLGGIWLGFFGAEVLVFVGAACYRKVQQQKGTMPGKDALFIPQAEENSANELNFSMNSAAGGLEEVLELVPAFCRKQQLSARQTYQLEVATEELLVHIRENAFAGQAEKDKFLDYLLTVKEDTIVIRIRYGGLPYNPIEKMKEEHDEEEFLGILLVSGFLDNFSYNRILDYNNLVIWIPHYKIKR